MNKEPQNKYLKTEQEIRNVVGKYKQENFTCRKIRLKPAFSSKTKMVSNQNR